jgi:hypothetical protein
MVSQLSRGNDKSSVEDEEDDDGTEHGIEVSHSRTDLATPTIFARTGTGRSLYEV